MDAASILILENDHLAVRVKALGAELCSVTSKQHALEYIWQAEKEIWPRHAPVLFPIVGRLKNNTYTYKGNAYTLPQHGFARDSQFVCTKQTQNTLVFELNSSDNTLQVFPFLFNLQIKYLLEKDHLSIAYHVTNPGNENLYFSIGAHPGFNCPLQPEESFEDYRLEFPGRDHLTCSRLADGLLTGDTYNIPLQNNTLDLSTALFANDALVLENGQVDEVSLVSKVPGRGVSMKCAGWPYFGIWSKKDTARFICLEPWQGIAGHVEAGGDLAAKQGIICLLPGQQFLCDYTTRFF